MSVDLGALYAASRQRITAALTGADAETESRPCPATPGWTIHDVVAHVRGVTEDVRTGNLVGVATDPWTAAQVARHRDDPLARLLIDWAVDAAPFEEFLSGPHGEGASRAVVDVHTHELDIAGGLGRREAVPDDFARWSLPLLTDGLAERVGAAGLPAVCINTDEGDILGDSGAPVSLRTGRFELFRALLGRRSPAQVAAFDWGATDPSPYLDHFCVFLPRSDDLLE